jgi:curved DNA-binding protein
MEYKDYYATLGVSKDAKEEDIKRSYRKLARKYHPDVSKEPNAEEKFKEVQEAYEVLKDTKKRAAYDQLGSQWKSGQDFRPPPGWQQYSDFDPSAFEGADLGGFSDFFSSIFGGRAQPGGRTHRRTHQQRGRDEHAKITISLEEAYRGGEKSIQLQVPEVDAHGQMHYKTRTLKISIPAGIVSGQQLRLGKQGAPGIGGGPAGDLYLEIEVSPHRLYTLQGHDIYLTLPIAPWEAALGAKITVPTLGGAVDMKIAPNSQTGHKLRLKGRGLPAKPTAGDQYILLQIVTPPAQTEAQKALYEKMAQEMPFNPRVNLHG